MNGPGGEGVSPASEGGGIDDVLRLFEARLQIRVPGPDVDLIAEGLMDSLVFVDLLVSLEQRYGVEVRMEKIDFEDFRTARRIADWVAVQRAGRTP